MTYKTLENLFYADSSSDRYARHDRLLHERLTADGTVRTGIHLEHGELFACVPLNLSVASERILRKERKISNLWNSLPYVALGASIRSLVLEEVVFSNEMEGVHSTRRQIEAALESAEDAASELCGAPKRSTLLLSNSLASTFSWWMVQVVPANPRVFARFSMPSLRACLTRRTVRMARCSVWVPL